MLVPFIDLAFTTVFDIFPDGIVHTFPVHRSMEGFLKLGCTGVLEVVVVPTYCLGLESSRQNHDRVLAHDLSIFNQLGGEFRITWQ